MKILTHSQLIEKLKSKPGVVIVGLLALTDARARKTNNPFGTIFKQIKTSGFVGADYERAVNRESSRQENSVPNFQAESLPWGEWLIPNKVITHKGEFYLRTQSTPGQRRVVAARIIAYRDETGRFIPKDEAKKFIPEAKESEKQQKSTGITQTVWVRTYKFNSIQKIRINGETFILKGD